MSDLASLRTHPDLVALCERRAKAHYDTVRAQLRGHIGLHPWLEMPSATVRQSWIEAEMNLLLDPADPDVDGLARVLAARVGLAVGATAPGFTMDGDGLGWTLRVGHREYSFVEGTRRWTTIDPMRPTEYHRSASLDGISKVTNPIEAFALCLLATRPHV